MESESGPAVAMRAKFKGSAATIVAALVPVVTSLGRSFVVYDECDTVSKASVDHAKISRAHPVLAALHSSTITKLLL
jgi:hypothetical protein